MKNQLIKSSTEIRYSAPSEYGVFATQDFKKNAIIEECPFFLLKEVPVELNNYIFRGEHTESTILALGYGSLYRRAELPNATWEIDKTNQLILFKALKNIYKGDEILIYYSPVLFPLQAKKFKRPYYVPKNLFSFLVRISLVLLLFFIFKTALFPFHHASGSGGKVSTIQKQTPV